MRPRVPLFLLATCIPALAAAQVPAGREFQVNTYTTGSQGLPSAGMDAAGRLVASWTNPISGGGTFAQRSCPGAAWWPAAGAATTARPTP